MIARTALAIALAFAAVDSAAVKEAEQFRTKHEADYRRDYVTLAGLFSLNDGVNTVGSAATSAIVLPKPAPASVGRMMVTADRVRFEPSRGAPIMLKAQPVTAPIDLTSDEKGPADAPAKAFEGFHWFPIDPAYRVTARFIKDPAPRDVKIPNQLGDEETYTTEGIVEFTLDGKKVTMRPMTTRPGRLYFIFRDGTSGKETYETARFLYADLKPDGSAVLDFNQAYNPPCSFNPYTTCPLPPKENRLAVRILAGEKAYPHPPTHTNQQG